ncbi:hypothetical protein [Paenibacillus sp. YN15]|uniref:hypothetical protein n=1 Tax=Paenibacillus sp. YN15 TaxID=1742774 RepID=UPI000DCCA9E5|nr:hypothetical protein [Paenibacillus sp. YN15]RAU97631.1 hypothetical protein DQG13_18605 [Paenibacillus sp. YN15]
MIRYRLVFAFLCVIIIAGGMGWQAQSSKAAETVRLSLSTTPEKELVFHNLKPGDSIPVELVIKNTNSRKVDYSIRSRFDNGDQSFYETLEIMLQSPKRLLYSGKLSGMTGQLEMGSLPSGAEEKLEVTAYFPKEAGNEFQDKAVVTVLEFTARAAPDEPDPEPSTDPSPAPSSTSGSTPTPGSSDAPESTPTPSGSGTPGPSASLRPAASPSAEPSPLSSAGSGASAAPGGPSATSGPPSGKGQDEVFVLEDEALPLDGGGKHEELPATDSQEGGLPASGTPYALPDTATPWYNLLLICTISIFCCAAVLWRKRNE